MAWLCHNTSVNGWSCVLFRGLLLSKDAVSPVVSMSENRNTPHFNRTSLISLFTGVFLVSVLVFSSLCCPYLHVCLFSPFSHSFCHPGHPLSFPPFSWLSTRLILMPIPFSLALFFQITPFHLRVIFLPPVPSPLWKCMLLKARLHFKICHLNI